MCLCVHVFVPYLFLWFICLFVSERERKKSWSWMGGEDLGRHERGKIVIKISYMKKIIFNKNNFNRFEKLGREYVRTTFSTIRKDPY